MIRAEAAIMNFTVNDGRKAEVWQYKGRRKFSYSIFTRFLIFCYKCWGKTKL